MILKKNNKTTIVRLCHSSKLHLPHELRQKYANNNKWEHDIEVDLTLEALCMQRRSAQAKIVKKHGLLESNFHENKL